MPREASLPAELFMWQSSKKPQDRLVGIVRQQLTGFFDEFTYHL
jgi:hypothetical protein